MKFCVVTYGCQMNVRDSESAEAILQRQGHCATAREDEADVLIVNTCSVRGKAEQKALGKLGLLVKTKRERPGRRVGVMGCMAQRLGDRVFEKVPGLDFAVGTHRLAVLPAVVERVLQGEGPVAEVGEAREDIESLAVHTPGGISAYVNVLLGCDRRCTYCIVPRVRGREWSRPVEAVTREVRALVEGGVREVTLLGQSVISYGRRNAVRDEGATDTSPRGYTEPFPRLLEAVSAIPGLARLRFTSGHPSGCTPELARAMAELDPVCEWLHLPVQSGSDRVLKLMRRGYTTDDFRAAAERLRAAVPDVSLTTDIIVGFPGETVEDFERTAAFMDEIAFDNAFIFKYSPRSGTPAAEWPDDVPDDEKLRRNKVLLADQDRRSQAANEAFVGTRQEVLVEGPSLRNAARWSGRTRTNRIAVFEPPESVQAGDLVQIAVERARPQTLYGRVAAGNAAQAAR